MSKIVQAVNSMISNKKYISNVLQGEREIFFLYKGRYKWSIRKDESDEYYLWFYPGGHELDELSSFEDEDWADVPMVAYRTHDLGTKEAHASFAELYSVLKERVYGMNDVLDDIISDSDEM